MSETDGDLQARADAAADEYHYERRVEKYKALIREARDLLGVGANWCENLHHEPNEYHKARTDGCPVEKRFQDWLKKTEAI